jgi:ParB family transcriptional regulator, chromosome partitioning protein
MASAKRRGLGRGLGALIPGTPQPADEEIAQAKDTSERLLYLDPRHIAPNPKQPRTAFGEEALEELAESIRRDGVQEPVIVRRAGEGYELVSGERRVRASVMADREIIPAICREVPDSDMLKLGLIENIQREDLNAIELARAYERLIEEFAWTQEQLASEVGKKRATVTNTLRLLNLPPMVQQAVADGDLSMGHARAILALDSPRGQEAACRKVIEQGLSVRQTEKLAEKDGPKPKEPAPEKDANLASIEDELRRRLGTRVALRPSGPARGKIEIDYFNLDDLDRILDLLRK